MGVNSGSPTFLQLSLTFRPRKTCQNQQCCCIPQQQQCLQNQHFTQGDDLVGEGGGHCEQELRTAERCSDPAGWVQGCSETSVYGNQQCGTRTYRGPVRGLSEGESSPGEFPWTCLILNQNNDFLGTCALVPQTFNNDLGRGTRKILTAAHNLKKIGPNDRVKVRVGEYDASG